MGIEASLLGQLKSMLRIEQIVRATKNADLVYKPHLRLMSHVTTSILSELLDKPINIIIHDAHLLITPSFLSYKVKLMPRYFGLAHLADINDLLYDGIQLLEASHSRIPKDSEEQGEGYIPWR